MILATLQLNMRIDRFLSTLSALFAAVSAQTISGLTFDGRDVVNLVWGFKGATSARYDLYLCAGDETTGSYVSGLTPSHIAYGGYTKLAIKQESLARVIENSAYTTGDWVSFRVDQSIGGNDRDA